MTHNRTDKVLHLKQLQEEAIGVRQEVSRIEGIILDYQRELQEQRTLLRLISSDQEMTERSLRALDIELGEWCLFDRESADGWARCFYPLEICDDGYLVGLMIEIQSNMSMDAEILSLVSLETGQKEKIELPKEQLTVLHLKRVRQSPDCLIKDTRLSVLVQYGDLSLVRDKALELTDQDSQMYINVRGVWHYCPCSKEGL